MELVRSSPAHTAELYQKTQHFVVLKFSLAGILMRRFRAYMKSVLRQVSKYGVFSGTYFPVFSPNTRKYKPEITPQWMQ